MQDIYTRLLESYPFQLYTEIKVETAIQSNNFIYPQLIWTDPVLINVDINIYSGKYHLTKPPTDCYLSEHLDLEHDRHVY